MNIDLRLGDCIEVMRTLPDNSVDSIITDPPYHLTSTKDSKKGFMGKEWDGGDIAFRTEVWSECLRVLKPGGHLLSFSSPRTYHRMAVAIEDAGFEIRDQIMWIFGSGFPKSHNIGKAIDKIQGNEREVVGDNPNHRTTSGLLELGFQDGKESSTITKGQSDWEGWGSALKPAVEPICMARKPLSEKSIAENVLKHGTGGINIDESRIGSEVRTTPIHSDDVKDDTTMFGLHKTIQHHREETTQGRFPANIMFECICDDSYTKPAPKSGHWSKTTTTGFGEFGNGSATYEGVGEKESGNMVIHTNPECPCYMLDQQSGISKSSKLKSPLLDITGGSYNNAKGNTDKITERGHNDKGGASRFFYCPKVSKKERNKGINNLILWENNLQQEQEELNQQLKDISEDMIQQLNEIEWNTIWSGNYIMEQYHKDFKFITETILKLIIGLKTLNYSPHLNIKDYIVDATRTIMENGLNLVNYVELINQLKQNTINEEWEYRLGVVSVVLVTLLKIKEKGKTGNFHATVKPIKLMEYLITLVTPKGGTVLEPFMGSGSTGIAAKNLGFSFIGIEKEQEYLDIAKQRIGE
jgi:DNA modification methylase